MNEETLNLFKTLTELPGAPGFERDIRKFVRKEIEPVSDEVIQDGLGSIFGVKKGSGPKIMVAGHMDEVGFMITKVTRNGMLKFQELGGWWSQVLLAQRVNIYTDKGDVITGIIGSTPPHLLSEDQRNRPMGIKNMYIDIGADDDQDAYSKGIRPGQQIVPICPFTPMANPKKSWLKHGTTVMVWD